MKTYVLAFDLVGVDSQEYPKVWRLLESEYGFKRETPKIHLPATTAIARIDDVESMDELRSDILQTLKDKGYKARVFVGECPRWAGRGKKVAKI